MTGIMSAGISLWFQIFNLKGPRIAISWDNLENGAILVFFASLFFETMNV